MAKLTRTEIELAFREALEWHGSRCLDDPADFAVVLGAATDVAVKLIALAQRSRSCNNCGLELRGTYWQVSEHGDICNECHALVFNPR